MLEVGDTLEDADNHGFEVVEVFAPGGQGMAARVRDPRGVEYVAKVFFPEHDNPQTAQRLNWLLKARLPRVSRAFVGPVSKLARHHGLGMLMGLAPGVSLVEFIETQPYSLAEGLAMAATIALAVARLEALGAAHNDIAGANFIVERSADGFPQVRCIDLDNVSVPGVFPATMDGQEFYLAPEVARREATPSLETDRFALAVLFHEILLRRHPFAGVLPEDAPWSDYVALLSQGTWPDDPCIAASSAGTTPTLVLSEALQKCFRQAFCGCASERPTAQTWGRELQRALHAVLACARCGEQSVHDAANMRCPWCAAPPPRLVLEVGGARIDLSHRETMLGRAVLGGSASISHHHLLLRRVGAGLVAEVLSRNGIRLRVGASWKHVEQGAEILLGAGDRLWFSDGVEGQLR